MRLLVLWLAFFGSLSAAEPYQWLLSVAAPFRDEADYLKEWIEYNRLIGVEHFFLYNNLSQDNYLEVLHPYIEEGVVDLIEWPYEHSSSSEWDRVQFSSIRDAFQRAKGRSKWLAIIDTDEFIVPHKHKNLQDLIEETEKRQIVQIQINWVIFGTSNIYRIPEGKLMTELLTGNKGPSSLYKSISRPEEVLLGRRLDPHQVTLKKGKKKKNLPHSLVNINHYCYRDQHFLHHIKIPRREKIGSTKESVLLPESRSNQETQYSRKIFRFLPQLRQRMGLIP